MRLLAATPLVVAVVVTVVSMVQEARSARILMAQPIGSRSHKHFFMAIAENLVQKNHTVTLVTGFRSSRQHPNIREVFVPDGNIFESMSNLFNTSLEKQSWDLYPSILTSCNRALRVKDVQDLFNEEFDLVMMYIYMTECFLSFVHKLKVPYIYVSPNMVHVGNSNLAGTPYFLSLTGRGMLNLGYPLSFRGRIVQQLHYLVEEALNDWSYLPSVDAECRARKLCPEDMPSLMELRLNSSLFITNSVKTMENPTLPYTPTVVHAGGIHCRPAKPLPQDLQQWITEAGKPGFILFSLGTLAKTSNLPEKYRKILVEVFGSLQQRVLWKWDEDTMEDLPSNVRLSKWLPQQDILGDSQLRLFITHGGLLSTLEATFHGVPVVGMPVFSDQHHNVQQVEREGWGRVLHWDDLTYDSLRGHILQVMANTSMRDEVQWRSMVMRDQPVSPGDWTTYWVEYVLRHQGAVHLRCPATQMPWYQLYNVDVWVLLVVTTLLIVGMVSLLSYKILRFLVRCCCGSRKTKKD